MIGRSTIAIALGLLGSATLPIAAAQSPDPNSPRYKAVVALSDFLTSNGDEALIQFVNSRVSPTLRDSMGRERLTDALNELRSGFTGAELAGARPAGPSGACIEFSNNKSISFEMEANAPHRFVRIGAIGGDGSQLKSAPGCGSAATPAKPNGVASLGQLDEKLRAEAAAGTFSGVVLVAKDGKPIFHEAYGYANKDAGIVNSESTKFNLGSINKIFTMVAVHQLLEAGKLNRDDTIGKYLPQFPPSVANKVTVQHLLDHRSGWGAYWENPTWNEKRAELRSLNDYMAFIKDIPLDFEPGSRNQYSNTGYEVLGAIVQKASGQSYYDYVRDHVYKPAGMKDTDAYVRDRNARDQAIGYTGGGYVEDNFSMLGSKGTAAGGGFSTTTDMLRFANALDQGTLKLPVKNACGLGGGRFGGGGPGVNASVELTVADGHTVIVLSSFDPPTASRVARNISGILEGKIDAATGRERYRIGVGLAPHEDGIAVSFLEPDSPGEKGGLKPDDVILAINGSSIADDPVGHFDAVLTKPDPIKLKVRRGSELTTVTLRPEAIGAMFARADSSGKAPCKPGCSGTAARRPEPRDAPTARTVSAGPAPCKPGCSTPGGTANRYRIGVGFAPDNDGIAVSFLEPNSPGEKGGLKPNDVILAIHGSSIADNPIGHFDAVLTKSDPIKLKIRRGSALLFVTVTPEAIGAASVQAVSSGKAPCKGGCSKPTGGTGTASNAERLLGVLTDAPDARTAEAMNLTRRIRTEGRMVTGVLSDSPADRAGLKTGDVLLQLGDNRLYSSDGVSDFVKTAKPGTFPIRFKRGGTKMERTAQITLSSDDLPSPGAGIRWQFSGMGQLDEALASAKKQGKRLLVGLSGSEVCCGFSRFEAPSVAAVLAGDDIARLAERYVTLIIRRPHAYWFLEQVSDLDENDAILAIPSGLKIPSGEVLPIPSIFVLDGDRKVIDQVALADRNATSNLRDTLKRVSSN